MIHIMMPMQLVAAGQSGNIVLQQVIQQVKPETSNFKTEWEVHWFQEHAAAAEIKLVLPSGLVYAYMLAVMHRAAQSAAG